MSDGAARKPVATSRDERNGADTVPFNMEPAANGTSFDKGVYGKATETVPPFVKELLLGIDARWDSDLKERH